MQLDPFRGETLATTLRLRKDDQRVVRIAQHARIGTAQADATRCLPPGSNRHLRHRFARNRDSRWVATSVEARRTACTSCGRSSLRPRRPPSPTSCAHTSRSPICLRTEAAPQDEGRGSYRRGLAACAAPALAPALTRRVIRRSVWLLLARRSRRGGCPRGRDRSKTLMVPAAVVDLQIRQNGHTRTW